VWRDSDGHAECWREPDLVTGVPADNWVVPDVGFRSIGLGEWSACGVKLDGEAICFPEGYMVEEAFAVPSLAELEL
jgi:hypothetical protein